MARVTKTMHIYEATIDIGDDNDLGRHRVPLLGVDEVGEEDWVPVI